MPSLRSAAALLAAADPSGLPALAALVGCSGAPAPLDAPAREVLGIPRDCVRACVASGPGTLRALVLDVRGARPMREILGGLAARLSARAPHLLWLVFASRDGTREVAIGAWSVGPHGPRVSALVVDRDHVVDSDAETLCALAGAMESVDLLTHARWVGVLGREAVTRRFYRTLERLVHLLATEARGPAPDDARREIALLFASRLLFLSFLEAKEWLAADRTYLARRYDACMDGPGGFQRRVLAPLFFGTLNTPVRRRAPAARALGRIPFLNGGLFARAPVERKYRALEFRDEDLGRFLSELLGRYRFTAREESTDWSEAAIDPEMLGRAFESLMATHHRRETGAFFTPHELVARVTDEALRHALGIAPEALAGRASGSVRSATQPAELAREALERIRVLDPACGSGAFLVHALERIAGLLGTLGDPRPLPTIRRAVLTRSIFGVDINPTAVWLCQLRLWLSIVIDASASDPTTVAPLPNLDRHVRVGDALAGDDVAHTRTGGTSAIARLRSRYARAVGARKRTLARALDREERAAAVGALDARVAVLTSERRDILVAARGRDLFGGRSTPSATTRAVLDDLRADLRSCRARRRSLAAGGALPFSFVTHFADVLQSGGFDVIVGNPPWVRVHRIPPAVRVTLRREYTTYRDAAWYDGATAARTGSGFGAQVDLAALFIERSLALAASGGVVALLVPAKLWRSLAGGGVRRLLTEHHALLALEDWSEAPALFDAAVYPSLVVVRRGRGESAAVTAGACVTVHAARVAATWDMHACEIALDETPGAPWLLLPPAARRAFDALRTAGPPLATRFGPPLLGVKCGCNGAFVVRCDSGTDALTGENGTVLDIERELLRPVIRGEHVTRWRVGDVHERIIWTHGADGAPLDRLPPRAERWFRGWRRRLLARADARRSARWWTVFRTESAASDVTRIVWADFGRAPRAAVLLPGDRAVPLNTCYSIRSADARDAFTLAALLNSPLVAAWLAALAEPARGGYRRFLGWTLSLLPLPQGWDHARELLAPVCQRAMSGHPPGDAELLEYTIRAYGLRAQSVGALLDWQLR